MSVLSYLNPLSYFGSANKTENVTPVVEQPKIECDPSQPSTFQHFSSVIKYDFDEEDQEDNSVASFELRTPSSEVVFTYYYLETEFLKEEWAKIYSEDPSAYLGFCTSNGEVSIKVTPTHTIFSVAKFGAGGDGTSTMKVQNEIALPVLRDCHTAWVERQRQAKAGELVNPDA